MAEEGRGGRGGPGGFERAAENGIDSFGTGMKPEFGLPRPPPTAGLKLSARLREHCERGEDE